MPTLEFKGKPIVYAHHFGVPFRPLVPDFGKSVLPKGKGGKKGAVLEDSNLLIHGDNLHALKALMPRYAGRVNCVCIDPPYNTGSEGWVYNDKTNSPLMREWLKKAVDREDLERHDKWLCMMWPRLQLLRELLSDDGFIFVFIDDNEQHRLRMMMDEIFGEENFIVQFAIQTNPRGRSLRPDVAQTHEYILGYAKDIKVAQVREIPKSEKALDEYNCEDEAGRFRCLRLRNTGIDKFNRRTRPKLWFSLWVNPSNSRVSLSRDSLHRVEVLPVDPKGTEGCWTWGKDKVERENHLLLGKKTQAGEWRIYRKDYMPDNGEATTKERSMWLDKNINHEVGKEILTEIFSGAPFPHPKSPAVMERVIRLACGENGIVLDSFAGSGTTAHAVLALNAENKGNRKFILVESEDYADKVTAERIRRVIKGVPEARDENLRKGFGGAFAFCKLGNPVDEETMFAGKLPDYDTLARYVAHVATGVTLENIRRGKDGFFGEGGEFRLHMIYEPDEDFLISDKAALKRDMAERIGKAAGAKGKTGAGFRDGEAYVAEVADAAGRDLLPDALRHAPGVWRAGRCALRSIKTALWSA